MAFQLRFLKPTCCSLPCIVPRTSTCRVGRNFGSREARNSEATSETEISKQTCHNSGTMSGHPQCTSGSLRFPLPPCAPQEVMCTRLGTLVRQNLNFDADYAGNSSGKSHRSRSVAKEHSPMSLMVLPDGTLLQPFIFVSPGKPEDLKETLQSVDKTFLAEALQTSATEEKELAEDSEEEKRYFDSDLVNETISSLLAQFEDIFKDNIITRDVQNVTMLPREVQKVTILPSQQILPRKQEKVERSTGKKIVQDMDVMMSVDVKKQEKRLKLRMTSENKVKRPSDNKVTEEQLLEVRGRLAEQMPKFFRSSHDYNMYHPNVVFTNDFLGLTTRGRTSYQFMLTLLRLAAWIYCVDVRLDLMKLTYELQDGTVQARWRVHGLPLHVLVLKFWKKDKTGLYKSWDAFSVFTVGSDGLIHRHHCSKMMPDPGKYRRAPSLWERIAAMRARPAATLNMEPTSLSLTAPKVTKADGQICSAKLL